MAQKFANAARGLLSAGINNSTTTIEITEGGSLFPVANGTDWFKAVLQDETGIEIVRVNTHTAGSNTFTVVRGQGGTTARSFALGSVFGQRVTAGDMEDRATLTDTQTLTNKTINIASNTLTGVAPLASPTFTGVPAAPTAAAATNTTQIATTAHVFAERTNTATLTNKTLTNPAFSGATANMGTVTTIDINGGTIDGTTIGASTRAAGNFTTLDANGNVILGDASTDTVTVNGYMGVGGAVAVSSGIIVRSAALSGGAQNGVNIQPICGSDATTTIYGAFSAPTTAASAFTVADLAAFAAGNTLKGAGSTITNQHGLRVLDQTQGTNNFGITSLVSSGTNKWNIYASGTAANYFAGNVGIGTTALSGALSVEKGAAGDEVARFRNSGGFGIRIIPQIGGSGSVTAIRTGAGESITLDTANTERLRIDSSGNVGIGTSSPAARLDVSGSFTQRFPLVYSSGPAVRISKAIGDAQDFQDVFVLLCNVVSGFVNASEFTGSIYVRRGTNASGNMSFDQEVSIRTAYNSTILNHQNGPFRIVTLTHNSVNYYALDISTAVRGNSAASIYIDGYHFGAEPTVVAASAVTNVVAFSNSSRLRLTGGAASISTNGGTRLAIDSSGNTIQTQPAPAAVNTSATLTVANLRTRIITSTTAALVTGTLPTGTLMDSDLYNGATDMGYDWSVINTGGTNNFVVGAGATHTVVGNMTVSPNTTGMFRSRRTAANTWITYRIG